MGNNIEELRKYLFDWHLSVDVFHRISPDNLIADNYEFFNDEKYKIFRESWCASCFSYGYGEFLDSEVRMRMNRQDPPDFEISLNRKVETFEIAECLKEGRKRGEEMKKFKKDPYLLTPYEPGRCKGNGKKWILNAIENKIKKYKEYNLLIYVNFEGANEIDFKEISGDKKIQESRLNGEIWLLIELVLSRFKIIRVYPTFSKYEFEIKRNNGAGY